MAIFPKFYIAIVGGFSTGRLLPYLFKGLGYECIHINAHPHMPERYTVGYSENSFLYVDTFTYTGSLEVILESLKQYKIKYVIPGTESGVLLADMLAEKLGLRERNVDRLSLARRDKYLMQQALSKNILSHIPSFLISSKFQLKEAIKKITFPAVLKPPASSDAEGVCFCKDEEELEVAFSNLFEKKDLYNQTMDALLLQPKIEGKEFVVNTMSWEGNHFITDIWSNVKTPEAKMYDYQDLINPYTGIGSKLSSYISKVLDALGIRFGAGHSEIILQNSEPTLVEIGARLHGDFAPSCTMEALGYNQLSVLANTYLYPDSYRVYFDELRARPIQKKSKIVSLISNCSGIIGDTSALSFFYSLKSFFSIQHSMRPNKKLYMTTDLSTSPGNIFLVSENEEQLQSDYLAIRKYEIGLYKTMLSGSSELVVSNPTNDQESIFHH